ncbi:MAG: hypothetical protein EBX25_04440 [Candidatus Fonsibacter ubiquis]|nr:hypothetical protein [Candidatus Fonsibacter ubiquis]
MGNIKTKSNKNKILIYFIIAIVITVIEEKMSDIKTFKDFPYAKLFAICDQSQKQYPEKFEEKWGK